MFLSSAHRSPAEFRSDPVLDLRLVREVLAGRPAAVDQLVERLGVVPAMVRTRNVRLGRPLQSSELDDLVQDCLAIVWRKLATFPGLAPLESWIYRVCSLEMMNAIRARRRRSMAASETIHQMALAPEEAPQPRFSAPQLARGLDRLGLPAAEIIRLKHFEQLTFDQIAQRCATPVNTVKSQYYRGLERLRRILGAPIAEREEGTP